MLDQNSEHIKEKKSIHGVFSLKEIKKLHWIWCFMPLISAIWEVEIKRITV
jgi:hypothetical protein